MNIVNPEMDNYNIVSGHITQLQAMLCGSKARYCY